MDPGHKVRKIVHISAPIFLVYYILPSPLWPYGPSREVGLLLAFSMAMAFEMARLTIGFRVPGMRDYEAEQISAGAWAAVALTFAFLFFPLEQAAPVVIGMALIDPLIGVVRRTEWYPWLPYGLYLVIISAVLCWFIPLNLKVIVSSMVVSAVAIAAESIKTSYVDDDFLILALPLVSLSLLMSV